MKKLQTIKRTILADEALSDIKNEVSYVNAILDDTLEEAYINLASKLLIYFDSVNAFYKKEEEVAVLKKSINCIEKTRLKCIDKIEYLTFKINSLFGRNQSSLDEEINKLKIEREEINSKRISLNFSIISAKGKLSHKHRELNNIKDFIAECFDDLIELLKALPSEEMHNINLNLINLSEGNIKNNKLYIATLYVKLRIYALTIIENAAKAFVLREFEKTNSSNFKLKLVMAYRVLRTIKLEDLLLKEKIDANIILLNLLINALMDESINLDLLNNFDNDSLFEYSEIIDLLRKKKTMDGKSYHL